MRALLVLVLVLAACGVPGAPAVAPNPARVIAATGTAELTMEIQELI